MSQLLRIGTVVSFIPVRLSESLYAVKNVGENGMHMDELNQLVGFGGSDYSCLPSGIHEAKQVDMMEKSHLRFSGKESSISKDLTLSGKSLYVDSDISDELQCKVILNSLPEIYCFLLKL